MNNITAVRYKQRLDNLFNQIRAFSGNVELQSHWAKYLCILTVGFLETSVRAIYSEYARTNGPPFAGNFVNIQLKYFQNPKMEKILELTKLFSSEWESNLKIVAGDEAKSAVDSIVAIRNRIAHGEWVGITYASVQCYYQNVQKVVRLIDEQCNS